MGKTIKQWAGVNSHYKREDGTEITHDELFGGVVDAIGIRAFEYLMPVSKEAMKAAYAQDPHLNTIPLKKWDDMAPSVRHILAQGAGVTSTSLSDCVCVLKAAARRWVQE